MDCFILVAICRAFDVAKLDEDVVLDARLEVDPALFLLRTTVEERFPATLTSPIVNDQLAVNEELERRRIRKV